MAGTKTAEYLTRLFWVLFGAFFLLVFAALLTGEWQNAAGLPFAALFIWVISRAAQMEALSEKNLLALFCLFFVMFMGMQVYVAMTRYFVPNSSGDIEAVYTGVRELVEHGRLTDSTLYFLRHEHQVFVLAELYVFTHALLLLGSGAALPYQAFGVLAAIGIDVAIVMLVITVKLCRNMRTALATGFCALVLTPLINGATYAYTHVLSYPYLFGGVLLFVCAMRAARLRMRLIFGAAAGAVLALGCLMARSMQVVLVAVLIFALLTMDLNNLLLIVGSLVLAFFVVTAGFRVFWANSGWIDMTYSERERIPWTHWVMVGTNPGGQYSEEDLSATVSIEGEGAKREFTTGQIKMRLQEMGRAGLVRHLWQKMAVTWNEMPFGGTVGMGLPPKLLREGMLPALLALMLAGAWPAFKKPEVDLKFICCLVLFGLALLLLMWETANRYIYPYLMLLLPPALEGAAFAEACVSFFLRRGKPCVKIDKI